MLSQECYFLLPNQSFNDIPTDIQHLYLGDYMIYEYDNMIFSRYSFPQIKSITSNDCCFHHVREFVVDGLESLESVKIGDYYYREDVKRQYDGIVQITNCLHLLFLEIGWGSFRYFKSLELSNLNSLYSIKFSGLCFQNVREFVLDGLESLESVKIGELCFRISDKERDDGICRIMNCPNLRQLEIGGSSFEDFKSFELSNLNSIQFINFGDSCFWYADLSLKGE